MLTELCRSMKKDKVLLVSLLSLCLAISCNSPNSLQSSNLGKKDGFHVLNVAPSPSSGILPVLTTPPTDVPNLEQNVVDTSSDILTQPKQMLDFETPPPASAEIVNGRIIVFYHNADKFRVRTTATVSSVNQSYASQVNAILDKYNIQSVHSYGFYDPADANRIICKDKKHKKKKNDDKDKNDKSIKDNKKDDKKFKVKHENDNDHNQDGHHDHGQENEDEENEKKCSSINYVDSPVTNQKILEEQTAVSQYFEGEFPDKLSMHIYEFPDNADTRSIATELRSLPFIRTAYPEMKVSVESSPLCDLTTETLSYVDNANRIDDPTSYSSFCSSNPSSLKCASDPGFGFGITPVETNVAGFNKILGREVNDWYLYNQDQVFKGWEVYGNTPMPKIAVIDTGFDTSSSALDRPNYVGGFSVEYIDTDLILGIPAFEWNNFKITPNDTQEDASSPFLINSTTGLPTKMSHGTFVSSIIGSPKNNSDGFAGLAHNSQIVPVKLINSDPLAVARAIQEINKDDSIDAINLSLGYPLNNKYYPIIIDASIRREIVDSITKGKIVVMAAGNGSNNIDSYPTKIDSFGVGSDFVTIPRVNGAIIVGGTTNFNRNALDQDLGTYISNFGGYGNLVDVSAPAQYITSSKYFPVTNRRVYGKDSGTSFSTPQITAVGGMIKKLAKANGVNLNPYQVKHILSYSANIGYDPIYGKNANSRYIGIDLLDVNHSPNKVPNIRSLNMYNALTIAKNLSKYDVIARIHNNDDYTVATFNERWGNFFNFSAFNSDSIIGITNPNNYNASINFKTLNQALGGYSYGYQLYYGKKYGGINADYYAGFNFFDKLDGSAGVYGAENNATKPRDYYAVKSREVNRGLTKCSSLPPDTELESVSISSLRQSPVVVDDFAKDFNLIQEVTVAGVSLPPEKYVWDKSSTSLKVLQNLQSGDVITITGKVDPNGKNIGFPNLINNNPLNYGVYYDFEESSGNTVYDKSGNNNHGTFYSFNNTLFPDRTKGDDGLSYVTFPSNSSVRTSDHPSYQIPKGGTFLYTFKRHVDPSIYQIIGVKHNDFYNPQAIGDFWLSMFDTKEIIMAFITPTNGLQDVINFKSQPVDIPDNKKIGIGISYDPVNHKYIIVKNQTTLNWSLETYNYYRYFTDIAQVSELLPSNSPMHLGNLIIRDDSLILDYEKLQDELHDFAIIPNQYLTADEMKAIFSSMGITD